jgi:plastocyanin
MMTWLIRGLLGLAIVVLTVLALGSRTIAPAAAPEATPLPTATSVPAAPLPTPRPTATTAPFVERIISRISRETQVPYPTNTPLPANLGVVSVVDFGYLPSVVRIHVGQDVVWQNGGRELHDVTGDDDWHSGPIDPSTEYRRTFGFEGTFNYRCSVHPDMRGTVIVTP